MKINEALAWLASKEMFGVRPGLDNIKRLLDSLGRPDESFNSVQVAGTNGKGSTCAFIERALRASGVKTGLFTSPHLIDVRERFLVDFHFIGDDALAAAFTETRIAAEKKGIEATYFEITVAAAALAFKAEKVEAAIIETGMGGRYDATTALLNRKINVITHIAMDHMQYLGDTIDKIALEKAGTMRRGVPAAIAPQSGKALETIAGFAEEISAEAAFLTPAERPSIYRLTNRAKESQIISLPETLSLKGAHQFDNAAAAAACITVGNRLGLWNADDAAVSFGLQNAAWPARLQLVTARRPHILLDVAHNPDGVESLINYLDALSGYPIEKRVGIIGILADKDAKSMLAALEGRFAKIILAKPVSDRAAEPSSLLDFIADKNKAIIAAGPAEALAIAKKTAPQDGLIAVTGSFYILGAVCAALESEGAPVRGEWSNC